MWGSLAASSNSNDIFFPQRSIYLSIVFQPYVPWLSDLMASVRLLLIYILGLGCVYREVLGVLTNQLT